MTVNRLYFPKRAKLATLSRCVALFAAITLGACASMRGDAPQDLVKLRANDRWTALVAGDFDKAYGFITPGFRAVVPTSTYRSRTGAAVKWVGAEVNQITCPEPGKCDVQIRMDYVPVLGGRSGAKYTTYLDEAWLLEDGQWWIHLPIGAY